MDSEQNLHKEWRTFTDHQRSHAQLQSKRTKLHPFECWNHTQIIVQSTSQHRILLVSWCFEPSQPQRITSGLNTSFILSPSYSFHKSLHHKPYVFFAYLYSVGTQHGNLAPAKWPILFWGSTQEPVSAAANTGKTRERFWKNADEWTGRVEISKEGIPGSKRSMHGNIQTYSRF